MSDNSTNPTATVISRIGKDIARDHSEGHVQNQVIGVFVQRENTRRVDLFVKAFDEVAKLSKAYSDINKPDQTLFQGETAVQFTSEKRKKEQGAALKKLTKLTTAIDNAFLNADYAGLDKALKGGGDNKNQNDSED